MSQHDYNVANAPGATVRADINALAAAIASQNSGASAPAVTFANMFWYDTTNSLLMIRNPANSGWITIATISGSTMTLTASLLSVPASGSHFGGTNRFPFIDTSGGLEIGYYVDFHPDAAGTEDYRTRLIRETGANGILYVLQTGSGGVDVQPGAGGFKVNGTLISAIPIGLWAPYGGTSAPTNWVLAYGQNVSRTTYAALFAVYGTTYGAGDGSTTFTLPDLRGRAVVGKDDMGGVSANRLTSALNGDVLGAAGGAETHTLSTAEIASHVHNVDPPSTSTSSNGDHGHDISGTDPGFAAGGQYISHSSNNVDTRIDTNAIQNAGAHTHTLNIAAFDSAAAGGGGAHNNVQPSIVGTYIIYAGV